MSKKVYKISTVNEVNNKNIITEFIVGIIVYALVLMISQSIFKGIYIENFFFALIAALILSVLNYYVKPVLVFLTLPLTIASCGIAYPIVNVIILQLCDVIMGNSFEISGLIMPFIIAIFISCLKIFLDNIITKSFRR